MKIQLIKIAEQQDEALYKRLYSMAHETKIGVIRDGKIFFMLAEYSYLMKHLIYPHHLKDPQEIQNWHSMFDNYTVYIASKYNAVYLYE